MKALKIIGALLLSSILAVFAYANLRTLSPSEKQKPVHVASFDIKADLNHSQKATIEKRVIETAGVTACSLSKTGKTVAVIYHPAEITTTDLSAIISEASQQDVALKEFQATGGGCPVHNVTASIDQFVAAIDLRH